MATARANTIHVGTSGWMYKHWENGRFYPEGLDKRAQLPYYAARFQTVEINNSFYRLPPRATFESWRARTPDGFTFAVKASRYITHIKRLRDPGEPVQRFWENARGLGPRLGPVLFQLPPRFPADPERLRAFVCALPREMRAAFEFRDTSWETDEVFAILDGARAAFVYADRPRAVVPDIVTGGWAYIRFHQGRAVAPGYPRAKLARWADRIAALRARETWIYFNNDTGGAALRDARTMTGMLVERGCDVARAPGERAA
jgi:uncharacterized protein YecE (DUF72 family)